MARKKKKKHSALSSNCMWVSGMTFLGKSLIETFRHDSTTLPCMHFVKDATKQTNEQRMTVIENGMKAACLGCKIGCWLLCVSWIVSEIARQDKMHISTRSLSFDCISRHYQTGKSFTYLQRKREHCETVFSRRRQRLENNLNDRLRNK